MRKYINMQSEKGENMGVGQKIKNKREKRKDVVLSCKSMIVIV